MQMYKETKMSSTDIVRAWKNEDYLMSLNPSELSALPQNPAGNIELHNNTTTESFMMVSVSLLIRDAAPS